MFRRPSVELDDGLPWVVSKKMESSQWSIVFLLLIQESAHQLNTAHRLSVGIFSLRSHNTPLKWVEFSSLLS